ncbi:MAG TPA: Na/Pi cotransporter family protein, partial [bacterium]|nr:Na/Pi cotransporter family protein [bacterium]
LVIFAIGLTLSTIAKQQKIRYIGSIILGFGLIFYGMHLMTSSAEPLKNSEVAASIFAFLKDHPFLNLAFAAAFAGFVHASAVTIGFAIALSFSGALPFEAAIPIVLGANVGTCITAALASIGMSIQGKRVAVAHILIKLLGVILLMPILTYVASWINWINDLLTQYTSLVLPLSGKIVLTHILFNLFLAIIFLPCIPLLVWMVQKIVPTTKNLMEKFGPKYLDKSALDTPPIAFANARHEILRISKIAREMYTEIFDMFRSDENIEKAITVTKEKDDHIDALEKAVRFYLSKLSQQQLTEGQGTMQTALTSIAGEFENIGDEISKDVIALARKKQTKMSRFSDEGWGELQRLHKCVLANFDLTIGMLMQPHEDIARKVTRNNDEIKEMEQDLRSAHLQRLNENRIESFETSTIHLDLLSQFRAINYRLVKTVYMLKELSQLKD